MIFATFHHSPLYKIEKGNNFDINGSVKEKKKINKKWNIFHGTNKISIQVTGTLVNYVIFSRKGA